MGQNGSGCALWLIKPHGPKHHLLARWGTSSLGPCEAARLASTSHAWPHNRWTWLAVPPCPWQVLLFLAFPPYHQRRLGGRVTPRTDDRAVDALPAPRDALRS